MTENDDSSVVLEQVREKIDEIESDERIHDDDADVQINPPLALHQVSQKRALSELRWVESLLSDDG